MTSTTSLTLTRGYEAIWPTANRLSGAVRSRPIIVLDEQDKSDLTHIHGSRSKNTDSIYSLACMVSKYPGIELKPLDGGKQVTLLVDSSGLGS